MVKELKQTLSSSPELISLQSQHKLQVQNERSLKLRFHELNAEKQTINYFPTDPNILRALNSA